TPVARRVRGFVAQTVNLAEIVDDLFVNAVQVRKFTRLVVRAATLFSEYPHGAARVPERVVHRTGREVVRSIEINRHDQRVGLPYLFEQIGKHDLRAARRTEGNQRAVEAVA